VVINAGALRLFGPNAHACLLQDDAGIDVAAFMGKSAVLCQVRLPCSVQTDRSPCESNSLCLASTARRSVSVVL
jgi:hypothetical protein